MYGLKTTFGRLIDGREYILETLLRPTWESSLSEETQQCLISQSLQESFKEIWKLGILTSKEVGVYGDQTGKKLMMNSELIAKAERIQSAILQWVTPNMEKVREAIEKQKRITYTTAANDYTLTNVFLSRI